MVFLLNIFLINIVIDLIIGFVYVLDWKEKRSYGHIWRKWLWFALGLRLLFPIPIYPDQIYKNWKCVEIKIEIPSEKEMSEANSSYKETANIRTEISEKQVKDRIVIIWYLYMIWIAGAMFLLRYRIAQYLSTGKQYLETAVPCEDEELVQIEKTVCSKMGIRHIPELWIQNQMRSPMLYGYMKKRLLFPENYTKDEWVFIIKHELTHAKKHDLWYKLMQILICDIYWFNPALKAMKKKAFLDVEYSCDEMVTREMSADEKEKYGKVILYTVAGKNEKLLHLSTQFAANKKMVQHRLENLFRIHEVKKGYIRFTYLIVFMMVGTLCVRVSDGEKIFSENLVVKMDTTEDSLPIPTKEEVLFKRTEIQDSMTEEHYEKLKNFIQTANLRLESLVLYDNLFLCLEDPDDLYWNYFEKCGDIQIGWGFDGDVDISIVEKNPEQYGTPVVRNNPYDGEVFIKKAEELAEYIGYEKLQLDLISLAENMRKALDTHDGTYVKNVYCILHDLDYFALRYGLEDFGDLVKDKSTLVKYYGVLNIYRQ